MEYLLIQHCVEDFDFEAKSKTQKGWRIDTIHPAKPHRNDPENYYVEVLWKRGVSLKTVQGLPSELCFEYINWKGTKAIRTVKPIKVWFGSTEYHREPQFLLRAFDLKKGEERDFAIEKIKLINNG